MTLEEIRMYCLSLPGVTEDIKWDDHVCFNVGSKMFLITNPDKYPVTASFKATENVFEALITRDGITPAPYLARNHWVHIDNIERLRMKEWIVLINASYELIFSKLTIKLKKQIQGL